MSVKRWSHVASKDGDFRTLIILDPAEPGYCEVVGEIIKPTHAAKIASAVNDYAALETRVPKVEQENVALRAKVAKLVAPISDEEWASTKTWPKGIWRDNLDTLIAARGRERE